MASTTVNLLIAKIFSILDNETSLLLGVSDEVTEIREELKSIKSFLEDADRKGADSEGEKTWVANVRDIADNIEDVIDEFMYNMNSIEGGDGCTCFLHHTIHIPKRLWWSHQTATKLQKINKEIKAISVRNQRYGVDSNQGNRSHDNLKLLRHHGEAALFNKEDDLVGIEDEKIRLMGWLMDEEPDLTVISIVGMGGSGKTVLVANTYTNEAVKMHFDCYAWITVSQTYDIEDLFRSLIKELHKARKESNVPTDVGSMDYKELLELLVTYLEQKRYLVVLDDVWDTKLWKQIKVSLPNSHLRSRIILTTRKEDVAYFHFEVKSHPYRIPPLGEKEAWKLFSMKAFSGNPNKCCPSELETLAWELVKKCEGLPLALDALGGLMSSKSNSEWIEVSKNLDWHLTNEDDLHIVKSILSISFEDLPYQLKHCFLYCSLFPEDYLIRKNKLSRLWIAQGFIEQDQNSTPEVVAERYLKQLIFRSMLQVVPIYGLSEKSKPCKMHDLMRELALSISKRENFCAIYGGQGAMEEWKARHLSIQKAGKKFESCTGMSQLRSCLVFDNSLTTLPPGIKMLRVLDLKGATIYKLPNVIVKLFNLRYLNLRRTSIEELPESIGRLYSLQTLDIRDTKIKVLPFGIVKLQNLRHLIMYHRRNSTPLRYVDGTQAPVSIDRLKNLQVLSCVEAEGDLIRRIGSMTQLTRIGITNVKAVEEMDLSVSIQNMTLLSYLFLMVRDEEESLRMDALSSPPPHLETLILVGKLERVPHWFRSLHMVTALQLSWSRLEEDVLPHIAALHNLKKLYLSNAYNGKRLYFNTGLSYAYRIEHLLPPSVERDKNRKGGDAKFRISIDFWMHGVKDKAYGIGAEEMVILSSLRQRDPSLTS